MDFYYMDGSTPCGAVMLTAKALGIKLNKKPINLMEKEHLKPEFLDINFQHCVPTLVDGDFKLWESRVISTYLVSKYGKDDTLYPTNPKQRALVDRLLYFDMGSLYHTFGEYVYPVLFDGESPKQEKLDKIQVVLGYLDKFLDGHDFAVGNNITVADHSLVASVSAIVAYKIDISKHSNVVSWSERCKKQIPGYETEIEVGAKAFGEMGKGKFFS